MDRRMFLGGVGALALTPMLPAIPNARFVESLGRWVPEKELQWAAILFRDFVIWHDELGYPFFYDAHGPCKDQTIHGWLVTTDETEYHYCYKIRLINCSGNREESIPMKVYKHRVSGQEDFMDYLCKFTTDWIMGDKSYRNYLPSPQSWHKYGKYFQTGAIC